MPRLPDITELGVRQIPQRTGGIVSYRPTHGAETAPGEALAGLGRTISRIGVGIEEIFEREKQHADKVRVEDAFNQVRNYAIDLKQGDDGFVNRRGSDAVNKSLLNEYSSRFDTFTKDIESQLENDEQREAFRLRTAIAGMELKQDLLTHIQRERINYDKQVYDGAISVELQNASSSWRNPNAVALSMERIRGIIDEEADSKGWAEDLRKAVMMSEESKIHDTVIRQALAVDDISYANAWFKQYKDRIEPATVERLQNAFDRYRSTADRRLEKQINSLNSIILSGFEPREEQIASIVSAARGTELEGDALQMAATAKATGEFRRLTPVQQEAYLTRLESEVRKDPTKFDITLIDKLRLINENQKRLLDQSPVSFAVRQGVIDQSDVAAQPLDLANPDGQALQARYDLAKEMRAKYGADLKPLTPGEQEAVTETLKSASWHEKLAYFAKIQTASGNDFDGYLSLMAQIAPDDPVSAIAGVYSARGRTEAAAQMLRGQEILRPPKTQDGKPDKGKLWPMPADTEFRAEFERITGDAYKGQARARSDVYQAALSIYAAKVSDAGHAKDTLKRDLFEESVKLATGGVEKWNGLYTVMPYGMSKKEFKDGLYKRIDALVMSGRLDNKVDRYKLRDMQLKSIGDGRYSFVTPGGFLVDKNGDRIIIDFNHPLPQVGYTMPTVSAEEAEYQEGIAKQRLGM